MITRILLWMVKNRLKSDKLNTYIGIRDLYQEFIREQFDVTTSVVGVKKGKGKYHVAYFHTPEGEIRVNLGRNNEDVVHNDILLGEQYNG